MFLSAPAAGKTVLLDPVNGFSVISSVSFPVPRYASGAPSRKTALSPDGAILYVLGDADAGGIVAYDTSTGAVRTAFSTGQHFSGLRQLLSGNILAVAPLSPRLSLFTPLLQAISSADIEIEVQEIL